jgi:hypothetical protein
VAIVGPSGFDGQLNEAAAALWTPLLGRMSGVVAGPGDLKPTIVAGDRSVQFAVGAAMQHAIRAPNTTAWTAQMGTISSGIRWDTFVIRRDWTANTATLMIVPGGTTQAVSVAIKTDTPGTGQTDQPLAIAQVTAGQQQPTALIDLREIASDGERVFASTDARDYWWPTAPTGSQALILGVGMTTKNADGSWLTAETVALTNTSGWQVHASYGTIQIQRAGRMRYLSGRVARIVQAHPAGAGSPFLTLAAQDRPPRSHTWLTRAGSGAGVCVVGSSDGLVQLEQAIHTIGVGAWVDLNTSRMVA